MRGEPHRRAVLGMLAGLAAAPKTALAQRETSESAALKEASSFFDIESGVISSMYDVSAPHVGAENTDPPIFLIGQRHANSFGEQFTNASRDEIVKSQETIVQLLRAKKFRDPKTCVFSEGETEETVSQYPRANELDKSVRGAVASLEKRIKEIESVSLDLAESLSKMVEALKPFSAYHKFGGAVRNMLLVATGKAKPEALQMLEHATVAFEGIEAVRGEPSPLILGALKHLHATDELGAICPAEIKEINLRAIQFLDEYLAETVRFTPEELKLFAAIKKQGELWDEYDKTEGQERDKIFSAIKELQETTTQLGQEADSSREQKRIRLEQLRVEKERLVSYEREMAMIAAINKRGRNSEAVVFGEGHADTLPDVLAEYNKQNQNSKRRLIILKLKEK